MIKIQKSDWKTRALWNLKRFGSLSMLAFYFCGSAHAQNGNETAPKYEYSGAFSYVRGNAGNYGASFNVNGGSGSASFNFNPRLGIVGDVGVYKFQGLPSGLSSNMYTFLAGPRLTFRRYQRVQPFFHFLVGAGHLTASRNSIGVNASETALALAPGAGIDLILKQRLAIRLFQFDYLRTNYDRSNGLGTTQNNWRISTGVVFRFGSFFPQVSTPHASGPPTLSCSQESATLYEGPKAESRVWASASASDGGPLTYEWTSSGGSVGGSGPTIRWNAAGLATGTYFINVRVADTHGAARSCSSEIRVLPRPNHPPVIACSATNHAIEVGQTARFEANAADPDDDPITLTWHSDFGHLEGHGAKAEFSTSDLAPGIYSIAVHGDDGRGGVADCTAQLEVSGRIPPALTPLEQRLALHSIYFPTDKPTAVNPNGGLMPSQQKTLVAIAEDFKKYLESKPDARLLLQGHADQRGAVQYNQALSERRVGRVQAFFLSQGIPERNIETLAYGFSHNLTETQVRELLANNPDLIEADRKNLLANMQTIVLANNRRVDIVLSTVLQQSERTYPFKVEDALTLIRQKPEREPSERRAPTRPR